MELTTTARSIHNATNSTEQIIILEIAWKRKQETSPKSRQQITTQRGVMSQDTLILISQQASHHTDEFRLIRPHILKYSSHCTYGHF
jgi:hypothetical protein